VTEPNPDFPDLSGIPDPLSDEQRSRPAVPSLPLRPGPSRTELTRARRVAMLVAAGWIGTQLAIAGIRGDIARVPLGYTVAFGVAPVFAGVLCLFAAVSPGRLGLGARVTVLASLALAFPALFVVANYVFSPPYPDAPLGVFANGVFCFNIAMAWTLLPLVAAGFALRGTFVTRATWRSALVGAGAGLVVAATSMLRCPLSGAWHNGLGHGGAVIASALLGALVLSRVTRA
jgi:hypothetical protein